jgi:ketosteroid isomerase-like protein
MTGGHEEPDDAGVIRAMFAAHGAGALEQMLALVHPEVVWEPSTPARSFYVGREGTLALVHDLAAVFGDFYVDVHQVTRVADGRLLVRGVAMRRTPAGELADLVFQFLVSVRDGRVVKLQQLDDESVAKLAEKAAEP